MFLRSSCLVLITVEDESRLRSMMGTKDNGAETS